MRTRFASAPASIPLLSFSLGTFIHSRDIFRPHTKLIAVALLNLIEALLTAWSSPTGLLSQFVGQGNQTLVQ
jgi:hypothetical protein